MTLNPPQLPAVYPIYYPTPLPNYTYPLSQLSQSRRHKKPLPLQKQTQHNRQRARSNAKHIRLTHRRNNRIQHLLPHLQRQRLDKLASHTRNRGLDLITRDIRHEFRDSLLRSVKEHRVRDSDRDSDTRNLGTGDEAHRAGDIRGLNSALSDRERGLAEDADADAEDDAEAVDLGGSGGGVDGVHEGGADDEEDAAAEVPGHVVPVFGEDGAVDDAPEDHEEDVGEDADAGLEGGIALRELEEEGDPGRWLVGCLEWQGEGGGLHVERDDDAGCGRRGLGE
jgi:hypothetical protein